MAETHDSEDSGGETECGVHPANVDAIEGRAVQEAGARLGRPAGGGAMCRIMYVLLWPVQTCTGLCRILDGSSLLSPVVTLVLHHQRWRRLLE